MPVVSVVYRHNGAHTENHNEALTSLGKVKELDKGGPGIRDEPLTTGTFGRQTKKRNGKEER